MEGNGKQVQNSSCGKDDVNGKIICESFRGENISKILVVTNDLFWVCVIGCCYIYSSLCLLINDTGDEFPLNSFQLAAVIPGSRQTNGCNQLFLSSDYYSTGKFKVCQEL